MDATPHITSDTPNAGESQLTAEQRRSLDELGFAFLGKLLSDYELDAIRQRIQALLISEGDAAGSELLTSPNIRHPKEVGADRLANLVNKGSEFDIFYTHPCVLAAVRTVLGPRVKLSSLNYRGALPGYGHQNLHADWNQPVAGNTYLVCNSIWLLDDFTRENGATRLVPRSHLSAGLPQESLNDPSAPHPDEILLEAPAGTVVVFNAHVWHGGTTNRTNRVRRAIHSYFCRYDQVQQIDQSRFLTDETANRIGRDGLKILGVER